MVAVLTTERRLETEGAGELARGDFETEAAEGARVRTEDPLGAGEVEVEVAVEEAGGEATAARGGAPVLGAVEVGAGRIVEVGGGREDGVERAGIVRTELGRGAVEFVAGGRANAVTRGTAEAIESAADAAVALEAVLAVESRVTRMVEVGGRSGGGAVMAAGMRAFGGATGKTSEGRFRTTMDGVPSTRRRGGCRERAGEVRSRGPSAMRSPVVISSSVGSKRLEEAKRKMRRRTHRPPTLSSTKSQASRTLPPLGCLSTCA
jgi:hypothetical protein